MHNQKSIQNHNLWGFLLPCDPPHKTEPSIALHSATEDRPHSKLPQTLCLRMKRGRNGADASGSVICVEAWERRREDTCAEAEEVCSRGSCHVLSSRTLAVPVREITILALTGSITIRRRSLLLLQISNLYDPNSSQLCSL